jgi:formylglycine-generating enzyme required for sulfatase activity
MAHKNGIAMVFVFILCTIGMYACAPTQTQKPTTEELPIALATVTAEKLPVITATATAEKIPVYPATPTAEKLPVHPPTERPSITDTNMILIPKGEFLMGSAEIDKNAGSEEKPQHMVYLSDYYIDLTEVTNGMYRVCVDAGACSEPQEGTSYTREYYYDNTEYDDYPVINVDWYQARTYCEWRGSRLPTEAEWEKAARGIDGRIFPWGNSFDGKLANFCDNSCPFDWTDKNVDDGYPDTSPAYSYPSGASPYGLLNMAGNVYEWVQDWYLDTYYQNSPFENPLGPPDDEYHVVRGGSWSDGSIGLRVAYRSTNAPTDYSGSIGFRCASSP